MGEMQVFNNEQFGQVRAITIDGEPWFVVSDVCDYFGVSNRNRIMQQIDEDEKGGTQIDTPGGKQTVTIINESGLYNLLFLLQPTTARGVSEEYIVERQEKIKHFKRWVTHEVLPSIRKHGAYIAGQESMTREQLIAKALVAANEIIDEKTKRITALEEQIESDAPFTEFGMAISTTKGSITVKQFAANLCQQGYKTGEKRMFEEFRQDGFLLTSGNYRNEPAQRFMEMGLFEVRTSSYDTPMGAKIGRQVLVTSKGFQYLVDYYMRKHGLMTLLTVHRRQVVETRRPR